MDRSQATNLAKDNLKNLPHATDKAMSEAKDLGQEGLEFLKSNMEDIRASAKRAVEISQETVRKNPMYAVLGAAAVGVVIGALFLRRSRE